MSFDLNGFNAFFSLGKGNADALAQSSAATVKAFSDLARIQQSLVARNVEKADAAVKALLSVKSPHELTELNTRLVRESIETSIADSRKLADLGTSAVTAAIEPFNARFSAFKAAAKAA